MASARRMRGARSSGVSMWFARYPCCEFGIAKRIARSPQPCPGELAFCFLSSGGLLFQLAGCGWNSRPSRIIRKRTIASFRASATRAFQLPARSERHRAQLRSPNTAFVRNRITLAASNSRRRVNRSPHLEIRPPISTSPDWYRVGVSPR